MSAKVQIQILMPGATTSYISADELEFVNLANATATYDRLQRVLGDAKARGDDTNPERVRSGRAPQPKEVPDAQPRRAPARSTSGGFAPPEAD